MGEIIICQRKSVYSFVRIRTFTLFRFTNIYCFFFENLTKNIQKKNDKNARRSESELENEKMKKEKKILWKWRRKEDERGGGKG